MLLVLLFQSLLARSLSHHLVILTKRWLNSVLSNFLSQECLYLSNQSWYFFQFLQTFRNQLRHLHFTYMVYWESQWICLTLRSWLSNFFANRCSYLYHVWMKACAFLHICMHTHTLSHKSKRITQPIISFYVNLWRLWVTLFAFQIKKTENTQWNKNA